MPIYKVTDEGGLEPLSELPEGAVPVHSILPGDILRPRGSLEKESISLYLQERLRAEWVSWTDPKYDDSMEKVHAWQQICKNLMEEVEIAVTSLATELFPSTLLFFGKWEDR